MPDATKILFWIIPLPTFRGAELALQLKPLIQAKAKENQLQGKDNLKQFSESPVRQNSDKPVNPKVDTYKEIAKIAKVSHMSFRGKTLTIRWINVDIIYIGILKTILKPESRR